MGRDYREGEGRGGERRSTCLPPRFDNPGYGPVRGGKGGRKGRKGKGRGEREGGRKGRTKGREGERDLAPPPEKNPGAATGTTSFHVLLSHLHLNI